MSRVDEKALNTKPSEKQSQRRERRRKLLEQKEKNTAANREYRKRRNRRILLGIFIIIVVAALFIVAMTAMRIYELRDSKDQAQQELEALQNKEDALREELKQVESDEYIIEQARSVLRMIFNGEILYVFRGSKDDPQVQTPPDGAKPQ
ncbi:MAG: septum formation initiator family protein [Firmicutes bacterium]|nr:septum formation initiator family protein [Bacillota bacterium]